MADEHFEFWGGVANAFSPLPPLDPDDVMRLYIDRSGGDPTGSVFRRLRAKLLNTVRPESRTEGSSPDMWGAARRLS